MVDPTMPPCQLFELFLDEKAARAHLERIRWKGKPTCPDCESDSIYERVGVRVGYYDCRDCGKHFTVRTGTILENSHVPLQKWIHSICLLMNTHKGISSLRLAKELDITQKTAWFILHRLRLACGNDLEKLRGIIEVDEMYIGGRTGKRTSKKTMERQSVKSKATVMKKRTRAGLIPDTTGATLQGVIGENVAVGAVVRAGDNRL